jgi:CRP-like cAMP-binding protein
MDANPILYELLLAEPSAVKAALRIEYKAGALLAEAGTALTVAIFPVKGVLGSNVPLEPASGIQVGFYGRRSVVGGGSGFGATLHLTSTVAQMSGKGWSLPSGILIEAVAKHRSFRELLGRHEQFMLFQAQQIAACNGRHSTRQRLATRLLQIHDFCGEQQLYVTQDTLADWLGVQRTALSAAAASLKDKGLIDYRRGCISLIDEAGLLGQACECAARFRTQASRFLAT